MVTEIDSETLKSRISNGDDILLVDVRTSSEVAQGALPSAIHIPMAVIPVRTAELPRDREMVIYCRSGARSYHTCQFLAQQGFDNAVNLRGGIIAWARHGYEIGQIDGG